MTVDPRAEELEHLRRIARVSWQLQNAEWRYWAARSQRNAWEIRNRLAELKDLKHQMRRLLDRYARRWGKRTNP